jgi:two-component system, cell cycle response regulator
VARIILVDDSASVRALLRGELEAQGHVVEDFSRAEDAAVRALALPPDALVTDLWMPSISGLQLCRLLRAEAITRTIPIILLTASDDKRTRFWANHAGATAFVTKREISALYTTIASLPKVDRDSDVDQATHAAVAAKAQQRTVPERLSALLDELLQTSTLAGELRRLGHTADSTERVFEGLVTLISSIMSYRWFALLLEDDSLFIHTHPALKEEALREAQDCFGVRIGGPQRRKNEDEGVYIVNDENACEEGPETGTALQGSVLHGASLLGQVALSPGRRGLSRDERRFISLIENELGGPLQMASLVSEAKRLAATDSLTGLLNRRAFTERVQVARARDSKNFSLLILDIDHFKKINDTRGHDVGDIVLKRVSKLLQTTARKRDVVARWGGEEFVIALPSSPDIGARIAAERVRRIIADETIEAAQGVPLTVTVSIGIATAIGATDTLDELIKRADKALYSAKSRGRNRVETA